MQQKVRENHLKRVYIVPGYSISVVCVRVCIFVFCAAAGLIAAE